MALMELTAKFASWLGLSETTVLVFVLIFFLFIANYVFETIKNTIFIGILSEMFPFIAGPMFGLDIGTNASTILYFMILGTGIYHIYELIKLAGKGSSIFFDILQGLFMPFIWIWKLIKKIFGIK